jgi:hypothetical protein
MMEEYACKFCPVEYQVWLGIMCHTFAYCVLMCSYSLL